MNNHLTLKQAAERLGLSYNTIRQYVHSGIIPATKVGKNRMIDEDYVADMEGRAILRKRYRHSASSNPA